MKKGILILAGMIGIALMMNMSSLLRNIDTKYAMAITIVIMMVVIFIWVIKSKVDEEKSISRLKQTGKKTEGTIVDYLTFYKETGHSDVYNSGITLVCPVIEFVDENNNKYIQIYYNYLKRKYEIGEKVDVYYIESEEQYEQLNWEKKIFLNDYYAGLKTCKKVSGKNLILSAQTLISDKQNEIENFPKTNININDIYIENDNKIEKKKVNIWRVLYNIMIIIGMIGIIVPALILSFTQ